MMGIVSRWKDGVRGMRRSGWENAGPGRGGIVAGSWILVLDAGPWHAPYAPDALCGKVHAPSILLMPRHRWGREATGRDAGQVRTNDSCSMSHACMCHTA
jgi:hypothetical protein